MLKNIIIVVVAVLLAVLGYVFMGSKKIDFDLVPDTTSFVFVIQDVPDALSKLGLVEGIGNEKIELPEGLDSIITEFREEIESESETEGIHRSQRAQKKEDLSLTLKPKMVDFQFQSTGR